MPDDPTFEEKKWQTEVDFRERELKLQERDQDNRDVEQRAWSWRSPLIIVILTAALAAAGNAVIAVVNGWLQRDLENNKRIAELALEQSKAESTRILEMIKTGDAESAAANLQFLLEAGLISDQKISDKVTEFLKKRVPGTGPLLPSPTERVNFEKSNLLTKGIEQSLQETLTRYFSYLDRLGFPKPSHSVTVSVEEMDLPNAHYQDNRVVIDRRLIKDPSVALHTYNHHILTTPENINSVGPLAGLESGLADYLACSFLNNPYFGENLGSLFELKTPFIRSLRNNKTYADLQAGSEWQRPPQVVGEVWGGFFWDIRERLGDSAAADALVASTWLSFKDQANGSEIPSAFIEALLKTAEVKGPHVVEVVRTESSKRKFSAAGLSD